MALELKHTSKKEGVQMAKFKLTERTCVYVDPKTHEERLAESKDKDNTFLLGAAGMEIDAERAEALGLLKAKKAAKEE